MSSKSIPVILMLVLICMQACCTHPRPRKEEQPPECGPELPSDTILGIVREAIRVTGGDPTSLESDHDVKITSEGCDYVVFVVKRPATTTGYLVLRIGRAGNIKSWPWCCEPQFFVPLPKRPT